MNPIRTISVVVDPDLEFHSSVAKAHLLANRLDAHIELMSFGSPLKHNVEMLRATLAGLAVPLRASGLTVTEHAQLTSGPLDVEFFRHLSGSNADLVVKDTRHHSIARRTLLRNIDWQLIRKCPVPLLLVKAQPWSSAPKVAAALDPVHANDKPSMLDWRIAEHARFLATTLRGELHAVHAYLPEMAPAHTLVGETATASSLHFGATFEEARRKQSEIATLVGADIDIERVHVYPGSAVSVLPQFAGDLSIDIMVIGAVPRRGVGRAYFGSTAEDVLERLPADAFVVKSPNFADALPF